MHLIKTKLTVTNKNESNDKLQPYLQSISSLRPHMQNYPPTPLIKRLASQSSEILKSSKQYHI